MALVSTSIPNLLNGVSQQPAPLRQVTQGETQTNALSSVIDGLVKRPPTQHITSSLPSPGGSYDNNKAAIHVIDRGAGQREIVIVRATTTSAELTMFSLTGTQVNVNIGNTQLDYLKCANPATDLKFLTVNDYTLILNTTKTVASLTQGAPGTPNYNTLYNDFSELPDGVGASAVTGNTYKIIGADSNHGEYYVKALSTKTYEESLNPGQQYKLDAETLPIKLFPSSTANTYYTLFVDWADRTVGDLTSVPFPSFVGNKISNLFFYKNRLGFLSGDNVIFSAAGDFFRFFPETVRTVLDDDPIDVTTAHTKASILKQAVAFNDSLTIFSDHTQFTIENVGALTSKTISIIPSTEFENDANVTPVGAGNYLYFASKKGDYSSVREYYIEADTVMSDALDITAHVPKYIPKNIVKLATSSNEDILACLSSEDRNKLYVYKWFSDGTQKLQSSWSTWELPTNANILDMTIIESDMYLVVKHQSETTLEKIDLQYLNDSGLSYCVRLDRKVELTGSYDSSTDTTTWTLPYYYTGTMAAIRTDGWAAYRGANITVTRPAGQGNKVTASGDYSGSSFHIGVPYTFTYGFSPQYVRERDGTQSIQSGRLQMRTMRVNYEDTGFFKIEVTPDHRQTYAYEYSGVTLNQAGSIIGEVVLNDGTFRFPLQSKNDRVKIEIKSDSFLPCAFQSAEWEGFYNIRSKRI